MDLSKDILFNNNFPSIEDIFHGVGNSLLSKGKTVIKVPGFGKEDITANINADGILEILGDNGTDTFNHTFKCHHLCFDTDLEITCEKGLLTIKLPERKPRNIQIK